MQSSTTESSYYLSTEFYPQVKRGYQIQLLFERNISPDCLREISHQATQVWTRSYNCSTMTNL